MKQSIIFGNDHGDYKYAERTQILNLLIAYGGDLNIKKYMTWLLDNWSSFNCQNKEEGPNE